MEWFFSCFSGSRLQVRVDQELSNPFSARLGFPHERHLGPILILHYAQDLVDFLDVDYSLYFLDLKLILKIMIFKWCQRGRLPYRSSWLPGDPSGSMPSDEKMIKKLILMWLKDYPDLERGPRGRLTKEIFRISRRSIEIYAFWR